MLHVLLRVGVVIARGCRAAPVLAAAGVVAGGPHD